MTRVQMMMVSVMLGLAAALVMLAFMMTIQRANAAPSPVAAASALSKPLVIIRFNQRRVFYEQALYQALSRAIEAAPAVHFHVVSYIPQSGDRQKDIASQNLASQHLNDVLGQMRQMGVPSQQMSVSSQFDASIAHTEVHVFVR